MEPKSVEQLKAAGELVDQAAKQIREAAAQPAFLSEAARQSAVAEIRKIRLALSMLRLDLSVLAAAANRRSLRPRRLKSSDSSD